MDIYSIILAAPWLLDHLGQPIVFNQNIKKEHCAPFQNLTEARYVMNEQRQDLINCRFCGPIFRREGDALPKIQGIRFSLQ
jgi:hypothetical protein